MIDIESTSRAPPSTLFTMRLWSEHLGAGRCEWRGALKNLSTGEVRYFRRWEEIAALVPQMLNEDV